MHIQTNCNHFSSVLSCVSVYIKLFSLLAYSVFSEQNGKSTNSM